MAGKPIFTAEQQDVIHTAAMRVWKRFKSEKKTQEDLALALGISQQSVSDLLKGNYRPGYRPARAIANLDGKRLEDLIDGFGDIGAPDEPHSSAHGAPHDFANLTICIQFHAGSRHWSAWTLAAARAGIFGATDHPAPDWTAKLDALEKALESFKKKS